MYLSLLLFCGAALAATRPMPTFSIDDSPLPREGPSVASFAPIVQKASSTVVSVFVVRKVSPEEELPLDELRKFFGPFGPEPSPERPGLGSGVIVSREGYILTNSHVVQETTEVEVGLPGNVRKPAKVIGSDPKTDIAVLKVEDGELPFATFGDSSKTRTGDVVLAIGNPFGVGQTVTMGIISATGRGDIGIEEYEDFLQTDAAINPGNSGGALIDARGRLVGINTAILSRTGGYQGIGFAVPANLARSIMTSLIREGKVRRGYLGVYVQDLTPELAKRFAAPPGAGALIGDVLKGSPAARAGLEPGDVIVSYEGKSVVDSRSLRLQIAQTPPGRRVALGLSRGGTTREVSVELKQLSEEEEQVEEGRPAQGTDLLSGVEVEDLTEDVRAQLRIPRSISGALVSDVAPASPAGEAGLRRGDVIIEMDQKPIRSARQAVSAARAAKGDGVLLRVWVGGGTRYVLVSRPGQ